MIKIYVLRCNKTKEIRYVGYTKKTLHERLLGHFSNVREAFDYKRRKINKRLSWLSSVNCDVSIELIDEGRLEDVHWLESMYITLFKSWGFKLTNMTTGGDGGNTWSKLSPKQKKEASDKISKANKGKKKPPRTKEHKENLRKNHAIANGRVEVWNKGKKHTKKHLENYSKARKGVSINKPSSYGKVRGTSIKLNNHSITFNSPVKAGIYLGKRVKMGNVLKCCRGEINSAYGYKWEFVN